jgi:stage II sporulation protein AA (anti-sigma F factor antagonist)
VVFDFKGVKFMDSAGIGFILGRYKTIDLYDGKMEIINVNEKIKRIFEMTGIPKIIDVFYDENNLKQIS